MFPNFTKTPSGMVINLDRIEYVGKLNAVYETERSRKPIEWNLTVQFINEDRPNIFNYKDEEAAKKDYEALVNACMHVQSEKQ